MQKQVPRIKPSQRQKRRYVLFELDSAQKFSFPELSKQIWIALVQKLGKQEALSLGFQLVVFDSRAEKGIFKCAREKCGKAKKAVSEISKIAGAKASLKTLSTSGTIKKLKESLGTPAK